MYSLQHASKPRLACRTLWYSRDRSVVTAQAKEIEPSLTRTFFQDRNRHAKEHVSAPGAPRRTASGMPGLCTPSPPSFVFGPINTRATSAGMGTMSKAHRHDSVSAVAHIAKHCGHGPTLNNMTSFVHYNIFCISRSHMHMDRRAFVLGTYFAHFFLYSTTLLYCRTH